MRRFYRALLHLYPAGFRAEYGAELERAFAERAARAPGPLAPARNALHALADVLPNALAAHAEILRQDARSAARSLRRTPGYAVTAVLVVALGVGANTAIFSLADLVFIRPLPFREPERLVKIWQGYPGNVRNECSPANFRDWRGMSTSFSGMAASTIVSANLSGRGEPRELQRARVTPDLFHVLGVAPALGRVFDAAEAEAGQSVLLSDALWRVQFGADPRVLGSTVRLNGEPCVVTGVMPASFSYPHAETEAWTPLVFHESSYRERDDTYIEVVARLRPGVSLAKARRDLAQLSTQLARQYPIENHDMRALSIGMRDELTNRSRLLVLALCGAALCILVLACSNLASLVLARTLHRSHELAVRAALGAGRDRLARQLVTESLGLAVAGGIVGVLVAAAGLPLLARLVPDTLPMVLRPALDLRALGFATGLVLVTGLAFGLAPALRAARTSPLAALGTGGRSTQAGAHRIRATLIVVEIAASVVLLVSSGLLIRAIWRLQTIDPGFSSSHVLAIRTALPQNRYGVTLDRVRFYGRVLDEVRALPGVRSAAYATGLPMSMRGGIWGATVAGEERPPGNDGDPVSLRFVTPGYFTTLGIGLGPGRDLAASDRIDAPMVAVVSESFARRHWPGQDPIGRRLKVAYMERTIVGVARDVRVRGLERASESQVYLPPAQVADSSIISYFPRELVVRTAVEIDEMNLVPAIRRIVHAVDPEQPLSAVRRLTTLLEDETAPRRTQLWLLGALALVALLIAGLGIHGLLMFTVSMRERELGIRRALGAEAASIVRLVLREGFALAGLGIGIGVVAGYAAARGMGALLVGVRPEDPWTLGGAVLLCFLMAIAGSALPALRAARVDPMVAIRGE